MSYKYIDTIFTVYTYTYNNKLNVDDEINLDYMNENTIYNSHSLDQTEVTVLI